MDEIIIIVLLALFFLIPAIKFIAMFKVMKDNSKGDE